MSGDGLMLTVRGIRVLREGMHTAAGRIAQFIVKMERHTDQSQCAVEDR